MTVGNAFRGLAAAAILALSSVVLLAQAPAGPAPSTTASSQPTLKPRVLAPGVITTIKSEVLEDDTLSGPRELVEIIAGNPGLEWTPNYYPKTDTLFEMAKTAILRRNSPNDNKGRGNIWQLEFSFKPLRMITVEIPQPTGKLERKLIWYLVYKVKNKGAHLNPVAKENEQGNTTFTYERVDHAVRFFPEFVLESREPEIKAVYLDKLNPIAQRAIQLREDRAIPLRNSVQMSQLEIPVSTPEQDNSVWGVATWEDIDGRIDLFSIYVHGLTNAYRYVDPPGAFKPGDPVMTGRQITRKILELNFWRPGDEYLENENEIRFGFPDGGVDHRWLYR